MYAVYICLLICHYIYMCTCISAEAYTYACIWHVHANTRRLCSLIALLANHNKCMKLACANHTVCALNNGHATAL